MRKKKTKKKKTDAKEAPKKKVVKAKTKIIRNRTKAPSIKKLKEMEQELQKWADEHEADFEAFDEEMEAWGENFEGDVEDFVNGMRRISDKHKVGSNAWKREVERLMNNQ